MRVNVNLASRKYEDVRRFFLLWGASLAVLVTVTAVLAVLAFMKHSSDIRARFEAHDLQQKISVLQRERNELRRIEALPENREVTQEKDFWNTQILKRAFSWTLLFNELQKIMPNRAYLSSVQPELTPDNRLKLKLTIIGERKENDLELIERMESSRRFHSTRPLSEVLQQGRRPGDPSTYKFEIETYYTPPGAPSGKTTSKEGA